MKEGTAQITTPMHIASGSRTAKGSADLILVGRATTPRASKSARPAAPSRTTRKDERLAVGCDVPVGTVRVAAPTGFWRRAIEETPEANPEADADVPPTPDLPTPMQLRHHGRPVQAGPQGLAVPGKSPALTPVPPPKPTPVPPTPVPPIPEPPTPVPPTPVPPTPVPPTPVPTPVPTPKPAQCGAAATCDAHGTGECCHYDVKTGTCDSKCLPKPTPAPTPVPPAARLPRVSPLAGIRASA